MAITFDGLEGIEKRLKRLANTSNVEAGLNKAAALVEREAKIKAPKGDIQQSISYTLDGLQAIVFTPVFYAPYVEYGTGIFAEGEGGGRSEVPWVFVEGSRSNGESKKKQYTLATAKRAMAMLREKGLPAFYTYGQKPQPYMRPALDENRDKIKEILREALLK